jgi:hypothetical protein
MRHVVTALLSAGAISAFAWATPAVAQAYGPWPYGVQSTYAGASPTLPSHTGAPTYAWHNEGPWRAPGGKCEIISGNRVCMSNHAFGPWFGLP